MFAFFNKDDQERFTALNGVLSLLGNTNPSFRLMALRCLRI
jgi:hypothetical protein